MMDTARLYFDYTEHGQLQAIRALTLECHLRNVAQLAEAWDAEKAYLRKEVARRLAQTRGKLIRAAQLHDVGKRGGRLKVERGGDGYRYSYRGHRFDVTDSDPYVQWLIRLHHVYAVDDITEAIADLKLRDETHNIAENFPLDLYTLEMCDQIEAEVENHGMGESVTGRVFMEFASQKLSDGRVGVDPYPFADEVCLSLEFATFAVAPKDVYNEQKLTGLIRDAKDFSLERKEVALCPWT